MSNRRNQLRRTHVKALEAKPRGADRIARALSPVGYRTNSFQRFLTWTNQKERTGEKLQQLIPPTTERLLDIGAGNGALTQCFEAPFREAVLLEPEAGLRHELRLRFPAREIAGETIEVHLRTEERRFDFIVASHVLQHVEAPLETVCRLIGHLTPGGRLAIVMLDPMSDWYRYTARFTQRASGERTQGIRWTAVAEELLKQGVPFEIERITATLHPPSVDALLSISDFAFATHRPLSRELEGEIRAYLARYLHGDELLLSQDNKVLVISAKRSARRPRASTSTLTSTPGR